MTDPSDQTPRRRRGLFGAIREHIAEDEEMSVDFDVDFSEYLEALRQSLDSFIADARKAGLDAPVPTAPEWDVRRLIAHQGMVHRWATDCILGKRVDPSAYETEGVESADPVIWLRDGGLRLIKALKEAPVDLDAFVFLDSAPPPRLFWARRQCHETTIHSVDALAARLGRTPTADETWVTQQVALDGIDELLTGFMTRAKSQLRSDHPVSLSIRPTDVQHSWLVRVSDQPPVVERGAGRQRRWGRDDADLVLEGTAEQLYLALWNRSDEVTGEGYDLWRRTARVSWS
ncbi:maleylpyruvate isomerase N-terminal domain-containing protein [Marmoricola sp. URHB0036]|uniref:maleylpyruvate isomerase N-terminal domain-containing protein n=1 Tax=Marmoricola sp. URHB0036 TaxID=1298863 RepID=UPI00041A9C2E|nr:maleylpyruvate isomerase N-terminal domain-containing protein [Marmoricola sp. URHB0036]